MASGIYRIRNTENGKCYIGSAVDFEKRWNVHRHHLRKGTHHSRHLQAAWSKASEAVFAFERILICAKENLILYEQRAIDAYRAASREHGYNARPKAESTLGMKMSEEAIAKLKARPKQFFSAETRAKLSASAKGRKMPAWFGEFARKMRTGAKHTQEALEKMSAWQKGVPQPLHRIEARAQKMNAEKARQIRELSAGGAKQTEIASMFGIHQSMVSLIASGKRWRAA